MFPLLNASLYRSENTWRDAVYEMPCAHVGEQMMRTNHSGACGRAGVIAQWNWLKRRSGKTGNSFSFTSPGVFQIKGQRSTSYESSSKQKQMKETVTGPGLLSEPKRFTATGKT